LSPNGDGAQQSQSPGRLASKQPATPEVVVYLNVTIGAKTASELATSSPAEREGAKKLAKKMPDQMQMRLLEMGLKACVEEVFVEFAYIVVRLKASQADASRFLKSRNADWTPPEKTSGCQAGCVRGLFRLCGYTKQFDRMVERKVLRSLEQSLCVQLPEVLPQKLAEGGHSVQLVARSPEEEAPTFFQLMPSLSAPSAAATAEALPFKSTSSSAAGGGGASTADRASAASPERKPVELHIPNATGSYSSASVEGQGQKRATAAAAPPVVKSAKEWFQHHDAMAEGRRK